MKIRLDFSWLIYFGHKLGMSREETVHTRYGEMLDMIACEQIMKGSLRPAEDGQTVNDFKMFMNLS